MLERNEIALLITQKMERNRDGFPDPVTLSQKEIFVAELSAKRSEFYAALANGHKVTNVLSVDLDDYKSGIINDDGKKRFPNIVIYDDIKYSILRTYKTDSQTIELTLTEVE